MVGCFASEALVASQCFWFQQISHAAEESMLKLWKRIKQMWRQYLRTCLWLPKLAVPISALRCTCDMVMWRRVTQVWLAVEWDLPHNLTALSCSADVFLQSTEDSAPLVPSLLNILGHWPQMSFFSSFLAVSILQGIIPPSKLVDFVSVFCRCY